MSHPFSASGARSPPRIRCDPFEELLLTLLFYCICQTEACWQVEAPEINDRSGPGGAFDWLGAGGWTKS